MAVAANADDYATPRQNVFFSGVIPSLDGQCVSLVKWFLEEMTSVPNPQAPRGDARYVGHTLVNQGHAVEVAWADRKRGDIVTYEYGVYGHIGVVLSGNRTFEENVNWPGVASKIVDGAWVYASRIGSLAESWRHDMHVYRINSYKEEGQGAAMVTRNSLFNKFRMAYEDQIVPTEADYAKYVGQPDDVVDQALLDSQARKDLLITNKGLSDEALSFRGKVERGELIPPDQCPVGDFKAYDGPPIFLEKDQ